jgi:hypothetical protein
MKCKSMLAALALMLTNGAANVYAADANNLPQYDSVAFCNTTSSIIVISEDFKEQAIESCMEKEKQAPDQIRRLAPFVEAATLKSCENAGKMYGGGSYQGIAGCLLLTLMQPILDGKIELSFPKRTRG